jgi:hypothetical protein
MTDFPENLRIVSKMVVELAMTREMRVEVNRACSEKTCSRKEIKPTKVWIVKVVIMSVTKEAPTRYE